jgi:hypothetical protein
MVMANQLTGHKRMTSSKKAAIGSILGSLLRSPKAIGIRVDKELKFLENKKWALYKIIDHNQKLIGGLEKEQEEIRAKIRLNDAEINHLNKLKENGNK